jgi:hypothetical protein
MLCYPAEAGKLSLMTFTEYVYHGGEAHVGVGAESCA